MKNIILLLCIAGTASCFAQAPAIEWQKSFGGAYDDIPYTIQQTSDGGYIAAGSSTSFDGDVTGNHGLSDYWVIKISASGSLQWQKSLGGSGNDYANSVQQTSDGGYIVAGVSNSNDGDVTGNHGGNDFWVVKLSATGSIQWQKSLGGTFNEIANSVIQTSDGGYIVAGNSISNDGDVSGNHGLDDYWVVKLSASGSIQWQKSYGGAGNDVAYSISQTSDGGFIVAGGSTDNGGDVTGNHGGYDYWIVKLSTLGIIQWQKSFGGTMGDRAQSVRQTADGGYIVGGYCGSANGDVTGNHGGDDCWVVKLTALGVMEWQKSLGGTGDDLAFSVQQTSDGGYVAGGYSTSADGDVSMCHGKEDFWIVKLDPSGSLQWEKPMGGTSWDDGFVAVQTADGGYAMAGYSNSADGDVTVNHGNADFWIVKLKSQVSVNSVKNDPSISVIPNPTSGNISIKGAGTVNIKAYNTLGRQIKEATNTDHISLAEFHAGMYFIRVYNDKGEMILTDKVMKQ
jgi:Secretion system C-terminal sorting domain